MARRATTADVLGARALNRALLARQMLLQRSERTPADAVGFLLGLQAQVPIDPYIALWSRLAHFDPLALSSLLETRKAVRIVVMRGTLHLVGADDALMLRALVQPALTRTLAATAFGKDTRGVDVDALAKVGRKAVEKTPLTLAELRPILGAAFPGFNETSLSYAFHYRTPLVQVPPRALWRQSGAPRVTTAEHWLGKSRVKPSIERVILRYLAAFGPASVMDAQAWSGLTKLAPVFEALRPNLVTFRDESGRELFDVSDGPRPDPDTGAPPRFLPAYDNATLAYAARERIIVAGPPRPIPTSVVVRAFLVDGFVAGFWKIVTEKKRATLLIEPFGKITKRDEKGLMKEGEALVRFMEPDAADTDVRLGPVY